MAKRAKVEVSQHVKLDVANVKVDSDAKSAVDFLGSRPQIAKMTYDPKNINRKRSRSSEPEEPEEVMHNRLKGCEDAWQAGDETINDFLKRLPVAEPSTADVGPWLWVCNPKWTGKGKKKDAEQDLSGFQDAGEELLTVFVQRRSKMESENPDKSAATITRKMGPYRDNLEEDVLATAIKHSVTYGKWMLFPSPEDLPRTWRLVAEATSQNRLGPISKVGTFDPFADKRETLIRVYTYNFTDMEDITRVLDTLIELGLVNRDGARSIYYKCDAYTHLDIGSKNPYRLRASLYSSKDVLAKEVKPKKECPIARVKKRNQTIENFFSS